MLFAILYKTHRKLSFSTEVFDQEGATTMKLKLCVTLLLLTLAATCIVSIVALVPLLVFPAFNEELIDYDPVPVTCVLESKQVIRKDRALCKVWNSCRQGCQTRPKSCVRYRVSYFFSRHEGANETHILKNRTWAEEHVPLKINHDACGDKPEVDCEYFFENLKKQKKFPCHYNRKNTQEVIFLYSWEEEEFIPMILAVGLPLSLFAVFLVICLILGFWYCRGSPGYDPDSVAIETERKYAFE